MAALLRDSLELYAAVSRDGDALLLLASRFIRAVMFGLIASVLLPFLKSSDALSDAQISALLTLSFCGDAALSLFCTSIADSYGRRKLLLIGSALKIGAGVALAVVHNLVLLTAAALVGAIPQAGVEVGPFEAIEQAALVQLLPPQKRTSVLAWCHFIGAAGTVAGALLASASAAALRAGGTPEGPAYRAVVVLYALLSTVLAGVVWRLSPSVEAPRTPAPRRPTLSPFSPAQAAPSPTPERPLPPASPAPAALEKPETTLGLSRSWQTVFRLSSLFVVDSFGAALVQRSIMGFWFEERYGHVPAALGALFAATAAVGGVLSLLAPLLARRYGLLNAIILPHVPGDVLLLVVPLASGWGTAAALLALRLCVAPLEAPARASYVLGIVGASERTAAGGVTYVARLAGAAVAPVLAGILLQNGMYADATLYIGGICRLAYVYALRRGFKGVLPVEERPAEPAGAGEEGAWGPGPAGPSGRALDRELESPGLA
eukprot:tig00001127_g7151.t1